jgi:hypothetical protein
MGNVSWRNPVLQGAESHDDQASGTSVTRNGTAFNHGNVADRGRARQGAAGQNVYNVKRKTQNGVADKLGFAESRVIVLMVGN